MQQFTSEFPLKATWASRGLFARFTPDAERCFTAFYHAELVMRARGAAMAAALVMVVYSVLDFVMVPKEILPAFLVVRYGFVITPMLLVFWASFQPWALRYLQFVNGLAAVTSGLAIIGLVCIARYNQTPIAYEGVILTLFYFYCCGGLALLTAIGAGAVVLVVYPLAEYHLGLHTDEIAIRSLFLWSANAVGIISSAIMEQSARRNFALATELNNRASRDYLTSLLNRRALRDRLEAVWRNAAREQLAVTVAMIDIDHFKRYNDRYGHAMGDEALARVAHVLQDHTRRPLDLAARYGGEEFLCVWSGNTQQQIIQVLQRLLDDVRGLDITHEGSPFKRVTVSLGVVQLFPDESDTIKATLLTADTLLYQAKEEGRNRAVFEGPNTPAACVTVLAGNVADRAVLAL